MFKVFYNGITIETDSTNVNDVIDIINKIPDYALKQIQNENSLSIVKEKVKEDFPEQNISVTKNLFSKTRPVVRERLPNLDSVKTQLETNKDGFQCFRCPQCGQGYIMKQGDIVIYRNVKNNHINILLDEIPLKTETVFTSEYSKQMYDALMKLPVNKESLKLQPTMTETGICPICESEYPVFEWIEAGLDPESYDFPECNCQICGIQQADMTFGKSHENECCKCGMTGQSFPELTESAIILKLGDKNS